METATAEKEVQATVDPSGLTSRFNTEDFPRYNLIGVVFFLMLGAGIGACFGFALGVIVMGLHGHH